ncbi:Uncharacterised protein [Mycobacteroides abscessus subsp. bolletii]|nr:Hypothetical protein ERS075590_02277 [Mycobacteroides abscessus]SKF49186.1 Uncharacterised protein [Mycobacteroides abscessus subsp. bolletii]SKH11529.1 Uncharacterised protein [Mycobacteroides abscessus subsp. bolletii]SLF29669.1 Uncharacterised protein [Mycobacteroides abscessus subsp. bolletii]
MLLQSATRVHDVRHEREGSIRVVMKDRWQMSPGLRRTSALVAIAALAVGGAKIASDHTIPGSGFSTVATVAADPTGPPGPTGGMTDGGGSQFQPPQMPSSMPDYQGGNQAPLDQNNGISIYNSGNPQAPQQVPGQQGAQQPQQAQQPAHGTQIPDYQTATPYTQGPGKANPDYQAPQQGNQAQQGQQQQQPSQAPTQTQQPSQNDQQDQQDRELKQQCQQQAEYYGLAEQMASFITSSMGGFGSMFGQPSRNWGPAFECNCTPEQGGPQKQSPESPAQTEPPKEEQKCTPPGFSVASEGEGSLVIDETQWRNALMILSEARRLRLPERAQWIALDVALRESHILNLGNTNTNPLDTPLSAQVPGSDSIGPGLSAEDRSMSFRMADRSPNWYLRTSSEDYAGRPIMIDVGGDNDSVGLFQQRVPIYGPPSQTMDQWSSANMFFLGKNGTSGSPKPGLMDFINEPQYNKVPENVDPAQFMENADTELAQRVQGSGPATYKVWYKAAKDLFSKIQACPGIGRGE